MASLTIAVGPLTSTVSVSDARFQEFARLIVGDLHMADGAPATNQQKLDWLVHHVGIAIRNEARRLREGELAVASDATLETEFAEEWSS